MNAGFSAEYRLIKFYHSTFQWKIVLHHYSTAILFVLPHFTVCGIRPEIYLNQRLSRDLKLGPPTVFRTIIL